MRVLLCLLLLLCVAVCDVCGDVIVPYKLCSTAAAHLNISSLTANEYPPVKSSSFNLTVNATVDEDVSSGQWSASGSFDGFPLPSSSGDISQFKPTPWTQGPIAFTDGFDVSSSYPSGSYVIQLSASDQNQSLLFCLSISFSLSSSTSIEDLLTVQHTSAASRLRGGAAGRKMGNQ